MFTEIVDAIKSKRLDNQNKKLTLELLKEFQSLEGLKKWFDQKSYGVRPNGVFYETKLEKLFITIEPKKNGVTIAGQMDDGSYLDQVFRVKKEDVEEIAKEIANNSMERLLEDRRQLTEELMRINITIDSTQERLDKNEFSSEFETKAEKKSKREAKKKMKALAPKKKK